jgi:hypothetical protein
MKRAQILIVSTLLIRLFFPVTAARAAEVDPAVADSNSQSVETVGDMLNASTTRMNAGDKDRAVAKWREAEALARTIDPNADGGSALRTVALTAADLDLDAEARRVAASHPDRLACLRAVADLQREKGFEDEARATEQMMAAGPPPPGPDATDEINDIRHRPGPNGR